MSASVTGLPREVPTTAVVLLLVMVWSPVVGGATAEVGAHWHRVDDHLASVVEVEHDHLEHVAGAVGSGDESSQWRLVVAHVGDHERIRDGVLDIAGLHTVFARRAVELQTDKAHYTTSVTATAGNVRRLTPVRCWSADRVSGLSGDEVDGCSDHGADVEHTQAALALDNRPVIAINKSVALARDRGADSLIS